MMTNDELVLTSVGIVALFLIWNRVNARISRDGFSPFHVMYFSWVFPLSLRALNLSDQEQEWTGRTIGMLLYVTAALATVSFVGARMTRHYPFASRRAVFERTVARLTQGGEVGVLLLIWAVVFAFYVYVEFVTNPVGVPLLSARQGIPVGEAHRWGKDTRWAAITSLLNVLTPMLYLAARESKERWKQFLLLVVVFVHPICGALKLSRGDIFMAGLTLGAVEVYRNRFRARGLRLPKLSPIKLTALAVSGVAFLALTLKLRSASIFGAVSYAWAIGFRWRTGFGAEALAQVYGYAALPFENFHRFFSTYEGSFRPGVSFLRPFLSAFAQGRIADAMLSEVPFNSLSAAAGSHTFLPHLYVEFGLAGLVLVPVIYAVFTNVLYVRFRKNPSLTNLMLYVNFLFPWAWLFFNNAFSVLSFYIAAAFIVGFNLLMWLLRPLPVPRSPGDSTGTADADPVRPVPAGRGRERRRPRGRGDIVHEARLTKGYS